MKIKMLCSRAGPDICDSRGDIIEVEDDEAGRMIAAGQAEPSNGELTNPVNTKAAVVAKVETATKKELTETAEKTGGIGGFFKSSKNK